MFFTGDSIQYLKMAYKVNNLQLPITDKWMPLYSIFIGTLMFSGLDIFVSVQVVNFILYICVAYLLFELLATFTNKKFVFLLAGGLLILHRELVMNSMTIMAELPMLFTLLLFFVLIAKSKTEEQGEISFYIKLSFVILISVFTKYNGLVLFGPFFYLLFVNKIKGNKAFIGILSIAIVFVPYIIWSKIKTENDIVMNGMLSNKFFDNISINLVSFTNTLLDFLSVPKVTSLLIENSSVIFQILFAVLVLLTLALFTLKEFIKDKKGIGVLILLFIVIYLVVFIYMSSSTGVNEVNQRTLFYPLIFMLVYLIYTFTKLNNRFLRVITGLFICMLIVFNSLKLYQTTKRFRTTGYGDLSAEYFKNKDGVLDNAIKLIKEKQYPSNKIFTNKHKLLPVFFDFELMNELPTNRQWLGNKHWLKDEETITEELISIKTKIKSDNNLIIYIGNDNLEIYNKHYKFHFEDTNFNVSHFEDGFIISN